MDDAKSADHARSDDRPGGSKQPPAAYSGASTPRLGQLTSDHLRRDFFDRLKVVFIEFGDRPNTAAKRAADVVNALMALAYSRRGNKNFLINLSEFGSAASNPHKLDEQSIDRIAKVVGQVPFDEE